MSTVFFLDVNYYGEVFRFSSHPIDLVDLSTGLNVSYFGGLDGVEYNQQSKLVGYNLDEDAISLELLFAKINWMKEWLGNRTLDGSDCVLYLGNEETASIQELDQIAIGKIHDSIFGYPDKVKGWISFSIENNEVSQGSIKILPEYNKLNPSNFDVIIPNVITGAIIPIVFGTPANFFWVNEGGILFNIGDVFGSPVYPLGMSAVTGWFPFVIAYGRIEATQIKIFDKEGGYIEDYVQVGKDLLGREYSYIEFTNTPISSNGRFSFVFDDPSQVFWSEWGGNHGGGLLSPYSPGPLTGAGDICLYFLEKSNINYDYSNWNAIREYLNKYEFSGYINDPEVTIWEWLQDAIISFLPIEIVNSGRGISPVVNLLLDNNPIASHHLIDNSDCRIITGLQPIDIDIVNSVRVSSAWDGRIEKFKSSTVVNSDNSQIARNSENIYGIQELEVEAPYIYDPNTATRIAHDIIAMQGLKRYAIELSTSDRYSYLGVGDIISISSEYLDIDSVLGQIISKAWNEPNWTYVVQLTTN